ncbi:hypothetical protein AA80_04675 [Petrotoga sibirica DSM 13575]|uniref:Transposase IS4-like domain-containing protein n=1 Tax=Petrotoga sibirica DSM 13575 TaxID=1122956 RepID=A0A855MUI3_9BACT|nr:hypothetical protein AA80_04675 [Petrotoga sibirica DSM 13575]POZ90678.1 hypothetical protein AD60_05485 [Petrotoga sp. SL27]
MIHFLKSNPSFAKCIGFDPIINYVPSEATFSSFKKEFDPSYLDKVIVFTVIKGIKEGINVPIFTVVSPASAYDKNYAFVLLEKVVKCLDLSGFNFLADAAYDSSDLYDYVHLKTGSIAFILLHSSSKKGLVGECGKKLVKHSHYLESKRNIYRTKFVCDDPSNCPLGKPNCYSYRNYSKYDFRRFLNRDSSFFKEIYKKRTLIESIFSRLESNNGTTSLKYTNAVQLECNLSNLFLIASALLAHKMGRDDLLSSPKTLMYETAS